MKESVKGAASPDYKEISDPSVLVKNPTVSVLMLAYNHEAYLARAIEGVLAQVVDTQLELIIGEDCSEDDTLEIAVRYQNEYPDLIRVIAVDTNSGPTMNHRRVMLAARGEFCAYLDGDDYWLPGKLAKQISYLRENENCSAIFTNALTVDQFGTRIGVFNDVGNGQYDLSALIRHGNFLNTSSLLYRASSLDALLTIQEPFIDYRWHLLLGQTGYLAQIPDLLTVYRVGSTGSMVSQANDRVRRLYWDALIGVPRHLVSDTDFAKGIADFLRRVTFRTLRTRRLDLLREWVPTCFEASPCGFVRMSLLVAISMGRIACKTLAGRFRMDAQGHRLKVLYRR